MGTLRNIAMKISLGTFFVMVVLGLFMGLPTSKVSMRAILGAAIAFVASYVALRMAVSVMVQSVIDSDETLMTVDADDTDPAANPTGERNENTDRQLASQE